MVVDHGARVAVVNPDLDVFTAALERVRWLYHEFDGKVCVTSSGGKDSTVVLELAARVAREEGGEPLKVWWLDQEAEFDTTVEYQRHLQYERDDIDFHWYQVPFPMENSMNLDDPWFRVWDEALSWQEDGSGWLREKDPSAITSLPYVKEGTIFYGILDAIRKHDFKGYITLDGMRCEESPSRRVMALTNPQYKWVTWSSNKKQPRFQPIYDWTYRDVWAAIEQNGWRYNRHYDYMYQFGTPTRSMRVSSFTHNQSLSTVLYLQEVEPELWERATKRFPGLSTFGHLRTDQYVHELPYMFATWTEYMTYLIENLVPDEPSRDKFRKQYQQLTKAFPDDEAANAFATVGAVVSGDHHGVGVRARLVAARVK